MSAFVIRGSADALPLPDESVDLIVTSPPYFGLRSYRDQGEHYPGQIGDEGSPAEYLANLVRCTREWMRVLKPSGSIMVNLGDKYVADNRGSGGDRKRGDAKYAPAGPAGYPGRDLARRKSLMGLPWRYAIGCIDELGLILRAEIVWSKTNGMPDSVEDRVRRTHEHWFHFTVNEQYFAATDEIREPHARLWQPGRNGGRNGFDRGDNFNVGITNAAPHPLGSLPGSVWAIATEALNVPEELEVDHYAAFPTEWPRRLITGWAPESATVLDPFGGTGTTALVASVLGRVGVTVDRSYDYCRIASWRTTDPGERARAMRVAKPPVQVRDQAALW